MTNRLGLPLLALLVLCAALPSATPRYAPWSAPLNLGAAVNSSANDATPAVSKKGTSLYFNSNRPGGFGGADLWTSTWNGTTGNWGSPVNLGASVNSAGIDASPALSRDEHFLFFHSNRGGHMDIWISYREHTHDDFSWTTPLNAGSGVNSPFEESMGGILQDDSSGVMQLLFASNRPGGAGAFDLYVSDLQPDGTFGPAQPISELNGPAAEPGVVLSVNGLEAFFYSARPGGSGGQDLWTAARASIFNVWSVPENLGSVVNSASVDQRPYLASDRETLFFASDRAGGAGGLDLYVTNRAPLRRAP